MGLDSWCNSYVLVRSGKGHVESIMREQKLGFYFEGADS